MHLFPSMIGDEVHFCTFHYILIAEYVDLVYSNFLVFGGEGGEDAPIPFEARAHLHALLPV